jgi:hypothetical protein
VQGRFSDNLDQFPFWRTFSQGKSGDLEELRTFDTFPGQAESVEPENATSAQVQEGRAQLNTEQALVFSASNGNGDKSFLSNSPGLYFP